MSRLLYSAAAALATPLLAAARAAAVRPGRLAVLLLAVRTQLVVGVLRDPLVDLVLVRVGEGDVDVPARRQVQNQILCTRRVCDGDCDKLLQSEGF